jgi:hypothetical protein
MRQVQERMRASLLLMWWAVEGMVSAGRFLDSCNIFLRYYESVL